MPAVPRHAGWAALRSRRPRGRRGTAGFGAEKSLLLAIRDSGGAITPVGAALETPLTVDEAEGMLLRLANEGHLRVESHDGTLVLRPALGVSAVRSFGLGV